MIRTLLTCVVGLILVFPAMAATKKEDAAAAEKERKEAQAEEEAELALPPEKRPNTSHHGRLSLNAEKPGEPAAEVVGTLQTRSATYQIKLKHPALLKALKPFHGRAVTLSGHIRNQGKYIVVYGVIPPPLPPANHVKDDGF